MPSEVQSEVDNLMHNLSLAEIEALDQAVRILSKARLSAAAGSRALWRVVDHAIDHIDNQIEQALREKEDAGN